MVATAAAQGRVGGDAVTALTLFVLAIIVIPARLVIAPLGAAGTPAILIGVLILVWWISSRLVPHLGGAGGLQPVRLAFFLLIAAILASYAIAVTQPVTASQLRALDRGLIMFAAWAGILLTAADGIRNRAGLDTLLLRLVWATTLLATFGIFEFLTGVDVARYFTVPGLTTNADLQFILARSSFNRVAGTTLHPIEFGVSLAMLLPIGVHYAIHAAPGRRALQWTCVAIIAMAIPMSISRSAVLGVATGGTVLILSWSGGRRLAAIAVSIIFIGVFSLTIPGLLGTIRNAFLNAATDTSVLHRTEGYSAAGALIGQTPFFGIGFNTFAPTRFFFLDNQYLGALIELGVVGTTLLIVFMLTAFFSARGARRRTADPTVKELAQTLAASVAVVIASFAVFDAMAFPTFMGLSMIVFGCCGALWRLETTRFEAGSGSLLHRRESS